MNKVDFYDSRVFKVWNYKYLNENPKDIIIDALAVLNGDYNSYRKQAAILLLKALLRKDFYKFLMQDNNFYPIDRNDSRVTKWRNLVFERDSYKCVNCGKEENLQAHHILKWSDYYKGRIDVDNGITLCAECHSKEHSGEKVENLIKSKVKK